MPAADELAAFIEEAGAGSNLRVEADLGEGYFRLRTDEADRRQAAQDIRSTEDAVIEMLRNSRDAHARSIYVAVSKEGTHRFVTVVDDGDGIPPSMHKLVFEPRVTSKLDTMSFDTWGVHGRGMALFSIASNAVSARVVASGKGLGTSIAIETDLSSLKEKTDQSTFPTFIVRAEEARVSIRGPKNILRTVCEFALEERKRLQVFIGSPSEIAATLYAFGLATVPARLRAFGLADDETPVVKRLAFSSDPDDFARRAGEIGLSLSSRTARRIMDGEIEAAPVLLDRIQREGMRFEETRPAQIGKTRSARSKSAAAERVKIDRADLASLAKAVREDFCDIARAYYLVPDVEVTASSRSGSIIVTIPIVRDE